MSLRRSKITCLLDVFLYLLFFGITGVSTYFLWTRIHWLLAVTLAFPIYRVIGHVIILLTVPLFIWLTPENKAWSLWVKLAFSEEWNEQDYDRAVMLREAIEKWDNGGDCADLRECYKRVRDETSTSSGESITDSETYCKEPIMSRKAAGVREIRANRFVLEDEEGKPRAVLGMETDGPSLFLYDENHNPCVGLSVYKNGTILGLYDENGKPRVSLVVSSDVGSGLSLCDENGQDRAELTVFKNTSRVTLSDGNGEERVSLTEDEQGQGLTLKDKNGQTRAVLAVVKDAPGFALLDENGKVIRSEVQPV